jgi:hypothetical protein
MKNEKVNKLYAGAVLTAMERYYNDYQKSIFTKTKGEEMFPMVLTPFLFDIFAHGDVSFVKKTVKNEGFLNLLLNYLGYLKKVEEEFKNGLFATPEEDYVLNGAVRALYKRIPQKFDMVGFTDYFNTLSEEEMKIKDNSLHFIGISKSQLEKICHLMHWGKKPVEASSYSSKAQEAYLVCLKTFVELTLETRSGNM